MHHQIIIIGGGQAGLSISYLLKQEKIDHLILDRGQIGDTWDKLRWDSFCLVTPNWQCRLPGFSYSGNDPKGFMKKEQIVEYIKQYAASFNPPIKEGVEVFKVYKKKERELFYIETSQGNYTADKVIIAAGAYHVPNIPEMSNQLPSKLKQIHSSQYKNSNQLEKGSVLVVGTGQSGAQIAEDLLIEGKEVYLSVGSAPRAPRAYRGKDVVQWLEEMGYYSQSIDENKDGDRARHKTNHYVTGRDGGRDIDLRQRALEGMHLRGRMTRIENNDLLFKDNLAENLDSADSTYTRIQKSIDSYIKSKDYEAPKQAHYTPVWEPNSENNKKINIKESNINTIIWCTGFKMDFSWVDFPIYDNTGYPKHNRGVTSVQGLYFIGLPWLHTWGSGRFSHVGEDAVYLVKHITSIIQKTASSKLVK